MRTDLQFSQNIWNHSSRSQDQFQLKVNAQLILIDVNGQRAIPRLESKEFLVRKGGSVMDQGAAGERSEDSPTCSPACQSDHQLTCSPNVNTKHQHPLLSMFKQ